ncbi:MAG TPA: 3-isopropylmalate dehydratase small subunit [Rhodospirillaceae bacterium]|nr:3-isopropylmalate dehydratase small subunit [Rhodospirillaceae bacterium]HAT34995.1 3-isopropylmalate dehydratase small subunit [Rhodospirillaceae bacterium]|tara:strand:+ start:175 stop:681 length:507 start_codon:yes stop_codon:yes gene_type:complete
MSIKGKAWVFGENINTDQIFPKRYFKPIYEPGEMATHLMEGADEEFPDKVGEGDIIVGGNNFGCGSSREEAPGAMTEAGVAAVMAPSFGRIFLRNSINLGLPAVYVTDIDQHVSTGDEVELDLQAGIVRNLTTGFETTFQPINSELMKLMDAGGLVEYTKKVLAEKQA